MCMICEAVNPTAMDCPYEGGSSGEGLDPVGGNAAPGNFFIAGLAGTQHWSETPTPILSYDFSNGSLSDHNYAASNWVSAGAYLPSSGNHANLASGGGNPAALRAEIHSALDSIAQVANITFNHLGGFQGAGTDFRFMAYNNTSGYNGVATFPGTDPGPDSFEAFMVFNNNSSSMTQTPELGGSSNRLHVAIHEIQHSLGIGHPHDGGGGSGSWTVNGNTAAGDDELDNDRYTVMSYERGGLNTNSQSLNYGYAVTPMALDVAALQYLYGSRTNHTSNTVYNLTDPGTTARDILGDDGTVTIGRSFMSIWDTGGTDTIQYSGSKHVLINLNEATLNQSTDPAHITDMIATLNSSSLFNTILPAVGGAELRDDLLDADYHAGGFFSRVFATSGAADLGGFSIANDIYADAGHTTVIEIANGGDQSDILIGNEQANTLNGNAGNDLILGLDGSDAMHGGSGNDELYGGAGNDYLTGSFGLDTLIGGSGNDTLLGGFSTDSINGGSGNDLIQVLDGEFYDNVDGGSGTDTLDHSASTYTGNIFDFGAGTMTGSGGGTVANIEHYRDGSGSNTIYDRSGTFTIEAGAGDDVVYENTSGGTDNFDLGSGNDTMHVRNAGIGGDTMNGGTGTDLIDFSTLSYAAGVEIDLAGGTLSFGVSSEVISNFENVNGSAGGETILGTSGINIINGNAGDDTINAGAGSDTVNAGAGDDRVIDTDAVNFDSHNGGGGNDTIDYSGVSFSNVTIDLAAGLTSVLAGNTETISNFENVDASQGSDTIQGTTGANIINGEGGDDLINGGGGADTINAGLGNDSVHWGDPIPSLARTIDGGGGIDTILGSGVNFGTGAAFDLGAGTYTNGGGFNEDWTNFENYDNSSSASGSEDVTGSAGSNVISTGGGANTLDGADGADTINGGGGNDTILGGAGADVLNGGAGDDLLDGSSGDGVFQSGDADTLNGGAGNDTLEYSMETTGGTAIGTYDGGIGTDTFFVSHASNSRTVNLATNEFLLGGSLRGTLISIENVMVANGSEVIGDVGANLITGTGNFANSFDGGAGSDTIFGGGGSDNIIGGAGGDDLLGESGADVIDGGLGNDDIYGNGGADDLSGGNGKDRMFGGDGGDLMDGGTGDDTMNGGSGRDTMDGGAKKDVINGGNGNDIIQGNTGADTMDGGNGEDMLSYASSGAAVTVDLGLGTSSGGHANGDVFTNFENLEGSANDDMLTGDALDNRIYGLDGNDSISGGDGNDVIYGGNGDDSVISGAGMDALYGGSGNDHLSGGADDDEVNGGNGDDSLYGGNGNDTVDGGNGKDKINAGLGDDLMIGGGGNDDFIFVGNFGNDTISDFGALNGEDIDLSGVGAITGFNDLVNNHLVNSGGFAMIVVGANSILLDGVAFADVGSGQLYSADDFIF